MRRSAIFAITVVVCACASWAQSLTEAQEHSALGTNCSVKPSSLTPSGSIVSLSTMLVPGQSRACGVFGIACESCGRPAVARANQGSAAGAWKNAYFWKSTRFHSRAGQLWRTH